MVLRIYVTLIIIGIILWGLNLIFLAENKKTLENQETKLSEGESITREQYKNTLSKILDIIEKLKDYFIIVFMLYMLFMFVYSIYTKNWAFLAISLSFFLQVLFWYLALNYIYFDMLSEILWYICFIIWMGSSMFLIVIGINMPIDNTTIKKEYVKTIHILEFKQTTYTAIQGNRFYIKSSPNSAYYYEVSTYKGGTTTKVIDGSTDYVEKYEDDKYIKDPHIDVYRVSEHNTNWYGTEMSKELHFNYYIYIPENSTFYEK